MPTYYEMPEVEGTATPAEIKSAYRRLAMKWHPDRNHSPGAIERFRAVNDAYGVLMQPGLRAYYDAELARIREGYRSADAAKQNAQDQGQRAAASGQAQRNGERGHTSAAEHLFDDFNARLKINPENLVSFFTRIDAWLHRLAGR